MYSLTNDNTVHKELPVIEAGLIVGEFDLESKDVFPNISNPLSFTCSRTGNCCTVLQIPITDKDILKIEGQGYSLDQIVGIQTPILKLPKYGNSGVEKYYWMNKKSYSRTCRFLGDDNQCEIYEFRPLGCRIFPFSIKHLNRDRVQIRIHPTNICKSVKFSEVPENEQMLKYIMDAYSKDLKEKIEYYEKYGDEI